MSHHGGRSAAVGSKSAASWARRAWSLVAGVSLACAVIFALGTGLTDTFKAPPKALEAGWQRRLQPLENAPLAAGSRVALVPPANATGMMAQGWLFEAASRRPDVLWGLASQWPSGVPLTRMVVLESWRTPGGWRVVWQKDGVVLAERDR